MQLFPFICLWFIYQNVSNSQELWNNTYRYEIFFTLYLGCSCITLREPYINPTIWTPNEYRFQDICVNHFILFTVRVKAQDPNNKFGNVLLWLQRESDKCDIGVLDSTQGLYHQPENCAHMVYKDTRPAAFKFTFRWTAPECGCILIRYT